MLQISFIISQQKLGLITKYELILNGDPPYHSFCTDYWLTDCCSKRNVVTENAAVSVGRNVELVKRLVEWCVTEDHPGVQGEANRLLAWLIKNSR